LTSIAFRDIIMAVIWKGGESVGKIRTPLLDLWTDKEKREGRRLTLREVSRATQVTPEAISRLLKGESTRFDAHILVALCKYFGVPDGSPVPFLRVDYRDTEEQQG
jgi:DNA-binding Xre family transcriptional regulator